MDIINNMTVGDIAIIEELSGQGLSALGDEASPKGKLMAAMCFVVKRKKDKDFTFADALDLTMVEVNTILGLDDEEDPKDKT
jgi:hypothetical protein